MRWKPLTMDFLLAKHGLKDTGFQLVLGIWILLIFASLASAFVIGFSSSGIYGELYNISAQNYILVQVPVFIGVLLVFWLGFEWGFIPVFLSTFMIAFSSFMPVQWAILYGLSFGLGLGIYAVAYYSVPVDISLSSLRSIAYFVIVSVVASLASSLGSFVWSEFFNLSATDTMLIWKGWWTGMFLTTVLCIAPLLYLFSPFIYRIRDNYFSTPSDSQVSVKWIYGSVISVAVVLILFILAAKTLGSQSITEEMANVSKEAVINLKGANESFEIVSWISIGLVLISGMGGIYLVGSWNRNLKEKVNEQTAELKKKEKLLREALTDRDHLLDEIHDRVRDNLTKMLALLELQLKVKENRPAEEILKGSHSRIRAMSLIHETMAHSNSIRQVSLKNYAIKLSNRLQHSFRSKEKNIEVNIEADDGIILDIDRAFPFAMILNELMVNAYTHAFEGLDEGSIRININRTDTSIRLKIRDNGIGLPEDIETLQNRTLGLRLVKMMARQLKAEFKIVNYEEPCFTLLF